ncbi:MAG: phosphoribosylformylglycinamidine synthase subunit PurL [Caldilineales bacterium]|nr:phosphoribosylformylglycinamidine synthase subunit PurL [Caldilineales bacterium]
MQFRIELTPRLGSAEGRAKALARALHTIGLDGLPPVVVSDLYFLEADLTLAEVESLAETALLDPVADKLSVERIDAEFPQSQTPNPESQIEITFLPGVTDSVADNLLAAARSLGYETVGAAASALSYRFEDAVDTAMLDRIARDLLANSTVQRYAINRAITPPFVETHELTPGQQLVEVIPICDLTDGELLALSQERRLSLDLAEMRAIQVYFQREAREPTDVELETLAQTWSEHCVHKTFRAEIEYREGNDHTVPPMLIDGILRTFIRAATEQIDKPWVHSAFVDNAGIVRFDDTFDLAFKVETHNHPSALEPFGGANTGVGGVIRDILGVSAKPIANTDVLCFGPENLPQERVPLGVLHPRRIAQGVIHGIEDYGNKMGIPTVNGAVHYHPGYTANPLVYCGCLGILPRGSHRPLTDAQPGDFVVAIGGRTGRDGLRGATFSSMEMDHTTGEIASTAVQIGNPIVEKQVMEVILRARDAGLYNAITDCGAGGFSSAVGEMGEHVGAHVQLQDVPLKYPGLRPWEIWLSEAQERMVLAVPPAKWESFRALCRQHDVEAGILGEFDGSNRLRVEYGNLLVADLDMAFLHDGVPRRRLDAIWNPPDLAEPELGELDPTATLLDLLAHPNIRSRAAIVHLYDHEVQGGTIIKPLAGPNQTGPSDAAVLIPQPTLSQSAIRNPQSAIPLPAASLSAGINPRYGLIDPYAMAFACVDEALRNAVAVGADPDQISILDNFCWGNPNLSDRLGGLVRCAQGCFDAAIAYQSPFISGKDSLNNEYMGEDGEKHAIPGTLLISALGIVPDVERAVTSDLKAPGNYLYLLGDTRPELGGSVLFDLHGETGASLPQPYDKPLARMQALHRAIRKGLVSACHDLSEGGLAVALAEMCIGGNLGAAIDLSLIPSASQLPPSTALFSESLGRFLIEVEPAQFAAFESCLEGQLYARIGQVTGDRKLVVIEETDRALISAHIDDLIAAFTAP